MTSDEPKASAGRTSPTPADQAPVMSERPKPWSALPRPLRRRARRLHAAWTLRTDRSFARLSRDYAFPDGSRRVYCHHIRKTAGTSLHASFLSLGGEDPMAVQARIASSPLRRTISGHYAFVGAADLRPGLLTQGHYFYAWSHLPAHQLALPPDTFTVTILRDPLRRVVSYFNYLRHGDEPGMTLRAPPAERALAADDFAAFLDRVPRQQLLRQLFTFSPTFDVAEAADAVLACSFAFTSERYEEGLSRLAGRLELPLPPRRDRVTASADPVSPPDLDRLREMLEPEYELLAQLGPLG